MKPSDVKSWKDLVVFIAQENFGKTLDQVAKEIGISRAKFYQIKAGHGIIGENVERTLIGYMRVKHHLSLEIKSPTSIRLKEINLASSPAVPENKRNIKAIEQIEYLLDKIIELEEKLKASENKNAELIKEIDKLKNG